MSTARIPDGTPQGLVKVYIYQHDDDSLYWGEDPISDVGEWRTWSEKRAHMIPAVQLERWKAVAVLEGMVADEMQALAERAGQL